MIVKEWCSPFNPFNSYKALIHSNNFFGIINNKLEPPIVANIDPTNRCNLKCSFCMFLDRSKVGYRYNNSNCEMPSEILLKLPEFLSKWGCKASCVSGGGEPTLHKDTKKLLIELKKWNIETLLVCNGVLINDNEWFEIICNNVKEIGFSVNAGSSLVYEKITGKDYFNRVITNICGLNRVNIELKTNLRITYKFILDDNNINDIYNAIKIAYQVGCDYIHIRPAEHPNPEIFYENRDIIFEQVEKGRKKFEKVGKFEVFLVQHKFNKDFSKNNDFDICPSPLTITLCADGNAYFCSDMRGHKSKLLTEYFSDLNKLKEYWGSKEHIEKLKKVSPKQCVRCTMSPYGYYLENIFLDDKVNRNLI